MHGCSNVFYDALRVLIYEERKNLHLIDKKLIYIRACNSNQLFDLLIL